VRQQITVSLDSDTGPVFHGASGALYGLGEVGVPGGASHGGAIHGGAIHGGGDERMLTALYGPADSGAAPSAGSARGEHGDASRQSATERDGALALVVGAAANECLLTGQPVRTADLVPGLAAFGQ
jgi:hypothetical protein